MYRRPIHTNFSLFHFYYTTLCHNKVLFPLGELFTFDVPKPYNLLLTDLALEKERICQVRSGTCYYYLYGNYNYVSCVLRTVSPLGYCYWYYLGVETLDALH